jgi:alpha-galactosidase
VKKIVIIGAGSFNFTRAISRDIFTFPALADSHIALVDLPAGGERMEAARAVIEKTIQKGGYPGSVSATFNRREALEGADAVLITIRNDTSLDMWSCDLTIPKKYGVDTVIGDTRGPSGVFRFLRSAPVLLEICRDIERYAPRAVVLNYTNPMDMVCSYLSKMTCLQITGLCHSVQGTAAMLAEWIGADLRDVAYLCAGINHQAFFLEYKWQGRDAYPKIRKAVATDAVYEKDIVRNEMFLALGYYPTESSGHNSEYNAWFRKRQDLIARYAPDSYASSIRLIAEREKTRNEEMRRQVEDDTIDLERGKEYAAEILNALLGDGTLFEFNGNVPNRGLITNLPLEATVEVPVTASKAGLRAYRVGDLPRHLAALNYQNAQAEELAVEGCIAGDRNKIYLSAVCDPLTSAVCSLEEIRAMVNEMFAANRERLKTLN